MKINQISEISFGVNQKKHPHGSVFYLQAKDFVDEYSLNENLEPSILENYKLNYHHLRKGDVLVLARGHGGFRAHVYNMEKQPAVASAVFITLRYLISSIRPEYVSWFINLESTQQYLEGRSRGTNIPAINKEVLGELEIPIPELEIQDKIVALSHLKSEESRLIERLNELKSKKIESQLKNFINRYE